MKLKKITAIIPLLATVTALSSCSNFFDNLFNKGGEDEPTNDVTKLQTGYYKDVNFNRSNLVAELQQHMFKKHTVYIMYGQYNSYCSNTTDRKSIENVPGTTMNEYFYTGKNASGYGTREHVWPCANSAGLWVHDGSTVNGTHNVDKEMYVGGGSDLFHVRTASSAVNTARGNSKFVDFDDPEFASLKGQVIEYGENKGKYNLKLQGAQQTTTGGYQYADKCEVDDKMKGDVARILLYVWTHYGDRGYAPEGAYVPKKGYSYPYSEMCGSLGFTNILGYSTMSRCAEKLIEWNQMDPPSEVEKQRNNTVQKIQGNRNPYVDFPELVEKVLDEYID